MIRLCRTSWIIRARDSIEEFENDHYCNRILVDYVHRKTGKDIFVHVISQLGYSQITRRNVYDEANWLYRAGTWIYVELSPTYKVLIRITEC